MEASMPQKRRFKEIRRMSGAYNGSFFPSPPRRRGRRDAIKFGEKLRDNTVHYDSRVSVRATLWRDRIQLVEKDDAGTGVARALKYTADVGFGLAYVHV